MPTTPSGRRPWRRILRRWSTRFTKRASRSILDVVFNHTAEGGEDGPTYSFRGIDNTLYYMLDEHGRYLNFSGCGNTFSSDHPVVRNYLLECLRNWVVGGRSRRFPIRSRLGARAATGAATCWSSRRSSTGSRRTRCCATPS